jgi:hypothetical protein
LIPLHTFDAEFFDYNEAKDGTARFGCCSLHQPASYFGVHEYFPLYDTKKLFTTAYTTATTTAQTSRRSGRRYE